MDDAMELEPDQRHVEVLFTELGTEWQAQGSSDAKSEAVRKPNLRGATISTAETRGREDVHDGKDASTLPGPGACGHARSHQVFDAEDG